MYPSMMIDLNTFEKPKYITHIKEAHNGRFAVDVELEVPRKKPMSATEAQQKITEFMHGVQDKIEGGPTDTKLREIYKMNNIKSSEDTSEPPIVGLHVFTSFNEMMGFLSYVYDKNDGNEQKDQKNVG